MALALLSTRQNGIGSGDVEAAVGDGALTLDTAVTLRFQRLYHGRRVVQLSWSWALEPELVR